MNANVGKYEPNVVKETITGKQVKCKVLDIDKFLVSLGIGDDKVFHIVDAFFDIDPEGYWWELNVIPVDDNSPVLDTSKMMESVVTNLDLIDNFYEQCV
jgi:hypothetical protein